MRGAGCFRQVQSLSLLALHPIRLVQLAQYSFVLVITYSSKAYLSS